MVVASLMAASGCGDSEADRRAQRERDAIRRVLEMDKAYAQVRIQSGGASNDIDRVAPAALKYVEVLGATDMSDLPQDVRDAYGQHIRAWRDMATLLDHYSGITGSFLKGYDGAAGKARYDTATKALVDTWNDVKAKAAAHGVDASSY